MRGPEGAGARAWGSGGGRNFNGPHAEDPRLGGLEGQGTRGVRTPNMPHMFVTRDVSKLTSWLKAAALCRGRKQGVRYEARCAGRKAGELGRVGQWRAQVAFTWRTSDWGVGGQGTRG